VSFCVCVLPADLAYSRVTVLMQPDSDMHNWVKELKRREEGHLASSTQQGSAADETIIAVQSTCPMERQCGRATAHADIAGAEAADVAALLTLLKKGPCCLAETLKKLADIKNNCWDRAPGCMDAACANAYSDRLEDDDISAIFEEAENDVDGLLPLASRVQQVQCSGQDAAAVAAGRAHKLDELAMPEEPHVIYV
jgi:hypothetical protein